MWSSLFGGPGVDVMGVEEAMSSVRQSSQIHGRNEQGHMDYNRWSHGLQQMVTWTTQMVTWTTQMVTWTTQMVTWTTQMVT